MAESILRLKVASEEYENKLKRASEGLQKYIEGCRKAGGTLEHLDDGVLDFVKALGSMETKSTSARGKISELRKGFIDMKAEYLHMTEAEKNGDIGKALSASLDQLKTRFHDAKNELAEINKELSGGKFGEFGNVLDTLGSKLGVTGNLTELLTSKTALLTGAVGAGIAVVTKSAEAWANYNAELAKQDQVTQVTTGLKGEDADRMTDKMRALSDTYKVDFREAVNAANTLMTQFGKTGDEATQLIKDGMRGMIQGDGPKLLSMIQQYAPAFRDAGISASQLVAIIHNSEGGIFTDQNMNAIVMGIKNIRLMTKATSDSLAQLGINGEEMTKKLNNGSITIFDALKQVVGQLKNAETGSKTAGEVMQNVFGRQGVTAGNNLAKAIETLNTDLEQTKVQTGEVGDAMADLQDANERLNTAIRDAFGYDGWDTMATGIKTKLVSALADVIDHLAIIEEGFGKLFGKGNKPKPEPKPDPNDNPNGHKYGSYQVTTDSDGNVIKATKWHHGKATDMTDYERTQQGVVVTGRLNRKKTGGGGGKVTTPKPEDTNYAADSIMAQEKLVAKLTDQYKRAGAAVKDGIKKQLDEAKKTLDEMQGKGVKVELPKGSMAALTKELQDYQKAQQLATSGREWREYQAKIDDVTRRIAILKGELPKGQQATFTVSVDSSNAEELKKTLEDMGDKDIKVTTSYDDTDLQDIPDDEQRTVTFTADDSGVKQAIDDIEKKDIPAKKVKLEVTTDSQEAFKKINDELAAKGLTGQVKLEPKVEPKVDLKGLNEQAINAKIAEIKKNLSGLTIGSKEWIDLKGLEADALAFSNMLQTAIKNGMDVTSLNPEEFWKKIFGGTDIATTELQSMLDQINAYLQEKGLDPIKLNFTTGEIQGKTKEESNKFADEFSKFAGEFVGGLSSVSSGLSKLGVELPEGVGKVLNVLQGVTEVINGVNAIIQSTQVGAIVANTAAVTANTAALGGSTVAGAAGGAAGLAGLAGGLGTAGLVVGGAALLGSIFGLFHNGGIVRAANGYTVPGNYGYDAVPAMLTSGELVLNRAQQGVLADALQSGGGNGNLRLETYVSGRDLRIVLNNESQGRLKGKYVTSNKR